jgi:type II secretory ATPase GspE/PulE/Tfp pilus assembly ATPase PilB-like protein
MEEGQSFLWQARGCYKVKNFLIMALSPSNSVKPERANHRQASSLGKSMVQADSEQMFQLIDSILPFEACLYHQVLPLSLKGTQLNLGMVNQEDSAALDYVRRILAYMNCSLVPQPISSERHQTALSAYLNHTGQHKHLASKTPAPKAAGSSQKQEQPTGRHDRTTLIVYSPDELEESELAAEQHSGKTTTPPPVESPPVAPPPQAVKEKPLLPSLPQPVPVPSVASTLPVLEIQPQHLSSPVEVLATLPPQQLLHELLGRILMGGIGRLYFERHPDRGRILWSQNGILQSVLEGIDSGVFQGVINELKRLTQMSLITVDKPKQVEIERLYQKNRLLLRLRVMPATHGEEATLQVLRGAALKFYQQQQIENVCRDALNMAQQLQRKVYEIRDRTGKNPSFTGGQLEVLPALSQLVKNIDQQLEAMKQITTSQPLDDATKS